MNVTRYLRHGLIGGMIGACLFSVGVLPVRAQEPDKLRQARRTIDQLQEELDSVKVQIDFLDLKVRDSRDHVRRLEEKSRTQKARVTELQSQIEALASESVELSDQIAGLQQEITRGENRSESILQRFRARLRHLHKMRQGTLLTSIFSASDLNTFLNRYQMIRYLLQHDRELLAELQKVRAKLLEDIDLKKRKQDRLSEVVRLTEKNRDALQVESTSLSAMLQSLLLERQVFLARQKKLKQTYAQLEGELGRIEKTREADPDKFDEEVTRKPGGGRPTPEPPGGAPEPPVRPVAVPPATGSDAPPDLQAATAGATRFQWPFAVAASALPADAAAINWLDLSIGADTEIKAAGAGKVYFKGPLGQFGNTIILAHRQGFTTLYGNLDELWVGLHQVVDPGEVIGMIRAGSGKPLRFEIRFGGKAQNPMKYLPPLR
ncbi:MAG TPA: peptidoglycan DD-metalloendopeptidase family protein [Candidatus Ozemobacteraceae bacterium]|nr:peptidoglycan DD-metalloendopeptidase family protein [Candidatus Ozemobacteraceae bacterium]